MFLGASLRILDWRVSVNSTPVQMLSKNYSNEYKMEAIIHEPHHTNNNFLEKFESELKKFDSANDQVKKETQKKKKIGHL